MRRSYTKTKYLLTSGASCYSEGRTAGKGIVESGDGSAARRTGQGDGVETVAKSIQMN
ncbi:hypothetical protein [Blautia obeum]|uniref:hypothetical protein n=1 Tax=Blautia obeum TaxID=40520 RepID=UPI003D064616